MVSIKTKNNTINNQDLYFVADIWANHNWSLEKAIELIHLAKKSWAHAAKFQNFQADKIVNKTSFDHMWSKLSHQSNWKKSVYEVYKDASISYDWTPVLKETCDLVGIDYFTSPYDFESIDSVDPYVDIYKLWSWDITWLEIVEYILSKKKPILIATWASDYEDVKRVMTLALSKTKDVVLMQCNTNYTGSKENFHHCNLNVLKKFAVDYPNIILGLSDHTMGHATVLWSIALWARVIEKHFTDDNNQDWPDHAFAMNPITWREMVDRSYELFYSLGDWVKRVENNEIQSQIVQRRWLYSSWDFDKGHVISWADIVALRPYSNLGYQPYEINELIWKELLDSLKKWELFVK